MQKIHRLREPESGHLVGIAIFRRTAHVEVGDVASIIPKFSVPRDQIYRFVTLSGRRFVSVHVARRWVDPWTSRMDMASQARRLERLLTWAERAVKEVEDASSAA